MWFGQTHPSPERCSLTRLSTSEQTKYKGWSCRADWSDWRKHLTHHKFFAVNSTIRMVNGVCWHNVFVPVDMPCICATLDRAPHKYFKVAIFLNFIWSDHQKQWQEKNNTRSIFLKLHSSFYYPKPKRIHKW